MGGRPRARREGLARPRCRESAGARADHRIRARRSAPWRRCAGPRMGRVLLDHAVDHRQVADGIGPRLGVDHPHPAQDEAAGWIGQRPEPGLALIGPPPAGKGRPSGSGTPFSTWRAMSERGGRGQLGADLDALVGRARDGGSRPPGRPGRGVPRSGPSASTYSAQRRHATARCTLELDAEGHDRIGPDERLVQVVDDRHARPAAKGLTQAGGPHSTTEAPSRTRAWRFERATREWRRRPRSRPARPPASRAPRAG